MRLRSHSDGAHEREDVGHFRAVPGPSRNQFLKRYAVEPRELGCILCGTESAQAAERGGVLIVKTREGVNAWLRGTGTGWANSIRCNPQARDCTSRLQDSKELAVGGLLQRQQHMFRGHAVDLGDGDRERHDVFIARQIVQTEAVVPQRPVGLDAGRLGIHDGGRDRVQGRLDA